MKKILILGAGKIGRIAAVMLKESGEYAVTLADSNGAMLEFCAKDNAATLIKVDVTDEAALTEVATGHDAILSTCPFYLNVAIARVAREVGASYFDVTEDVETTRAIREISKGAAGAFVPQCGLAPGFISIACTTEPTGMLRIGIALPALIGDCVPDCTWSPAFRPLGASM